MTKAKKNFLVAVRGQPDWFRAVTATQAGNYGVRIDGLGQKVTVLNASGYHSLLTRLLADNAVIKGELAQAVAKGVISKPQRFQETLAMARDVELSERQLHIDLDREEEMFETLGAEELERVESDLAFMRALPDSYYSPGPSLDRILRLTAALERADAMRAAGGGESTIAAFLQTLKNEDLITLSEQLNPVRLDHYTRDSLMRHWNEAGRRYDGTPYDGFTVEKNRFIHRSAVERLAPRPQDDFLP